MVDSLNSTNKISQLTFLPHLFSSENQVNLSVPLTDHEIDSLKLSCMQHIKNVIRPFGEYDINMKVTMQY